MNTVRIPASQVIPFFRDFFNGKYPALRLGQAFMNAFSINGISTLFYEKNDTNAMKYIWENMTDFSS
jgi:hypothetical protein